MRNTSAVGLTTVLKVRRVSGSYLQTELGLDAFSGGLMKIEQSTAFFNTVVGSTSVPTVANCEFQYRSCADDSEASMEENNHPGLDCCQSSCRATELVSRRAWGHQA